MYGVHCTARQCTPRPAPQRAALHSTAHCTVLHRAALQTRAPHYPAGTRHGTALDSTAPRCAAPHSTARCTVLNRAALQSPALQYTALLSIAPQVHCTPTPTVSQALLSSFNSLTRHFMDIAAAIKARAEAIFEKERSPPTAPFEGAGGHSMTLNSFRSQRSTRQLRDFPKLLEVDDFYSRLHRQFSWLLWCFTTCRSDSSPSLWPGGVLTTPLHSCVLLVGRLSQLPNDGSVGAERTMVRNEAAAPRPPPPPRLKFRYSPLKFR